MTDFLDEREVNDTVFSAARDGHLFRLRLSLNCLPKAVVQKVISTRTSGATPLVIAARNGHWEIVDYLIKHWNAEIEQVGSVVFDGETIEGAPSLWCAAAAGHFQIVKLLIQNGACVNSTTSTNSTPLRAACFDGHYDIVRYLVEHNADIEIANRHGHTCLMIACFRGHYKIAKYLIELGADVNRKSAKGNTALHDCAESGSLEILKLLLNHGAKMDVDSYGMTPLLAASVTGNAEIVEYLVSLPMCTKKEKVDALELLGATYVDKKRDMLSALKFWRFAMEERLSDSILQKIISLSPIAAYEHTIEFTTTEELEDLISDPDEMRMQALLIRERILGPAHPDTSYYIRYRGAVYADTGNFDRCINLWMYALDMQQKILEPLSPMIQSSFLSFAELFSFMMSESHNRNRSIPPVAFCDIITVFHKAVHEVEVGMQHLAKIPVADRDSTNFSRILIIVMHLVCLLCRLQSYLTSSQKFTLRKAVYDFIHLQPKGRNGWTPLHLACTHDSSSVGRYPICLFPAVEVVKLLLDVGACPNAKDYDHNTPLHIAAMNKPSKEALIQLLLDRGAHYDACNLNRQTFVNLLHDASLIKQINPLNYISLQCIAAKSITKHQIPYKGKIPQKLEFFVETH